MTDTITLNDEDIRILKGEFGEETASKIIIAITEYPKLKERLQHTQEMNTGVGNQNLVYQREIKEYLKQIKELQDNYTSQSKYLNEITKELSTLQQLKQRVAELKKYCVGQETIEVIELMRRGFA